MSWDDIGALADLREELSMAILQAPFCISFSANSHFFGTVFTFYLGYLNSNLFRFVQPILYPHLFKSIGLATPAGVLLYGDLFFRVSLAPLLL